MIHDFPFVFSWSYLFQQTVKPFTTRFHELQKLDKDYFESLKPAEMLSTATKILASLGHESSGKWLGTRQIRWPTKGATSGKDKMSSDSKSVVELNIGVSRTMLNAKYTTVYIGNLDTEVSQVDRHRHFFSLGAGVIDEVRVQRDKGFGFVRYSTHLETAFAIQLGNTHSYLGGMHLRS
ncbi:unnamed protein product [Eruca vesicaria subsp. sativa]|uniref:RRM domain-containing protein n=1 Tax=Eruca vesicaria subsp. sativa TaxID=29727 RepID=A0ABC8JLS1_ERUVS|nr:unnamed protein product [Eruca vesicaria subsp. sativa]